MAADLLEETGVKHPLLTLLVRSFQKLLNAGIAIIDGNLNLFAGFLVYVYPLSERFPSSARERGSPLESFGHLLQRNEDTNYHQIARSSLHIHHLLHYSKSLVHESSPLKFSNMGN